MRVAVIANGEWDTEWGHSELSSKKFDILICADGGSNLAVSAGKIPDVLIGDLDSISSKNLRKCQEHNTIIKEYPKEKDQTDLELAVEYADSYLQANGKPEDEIVLYAAGGKRLDHLLGNIALMLGWAQKKRIVRMVDKSYQAWIMLPGTQIIHGTKGQELSIVALTEKAKVASQGLYYELNDLTLLQSSARGISNVFRNEQAEIKLLEGLIMVIILMESDKT